MRLAIAEGLLEVVSDDLLQLLDPLPGDPNAPVREPTVLLGSALLGDRGVRGIADQDVPELERVLAGDRRSCLADELLAHERAHERPRVRAVRFREELPDRAEVEVLADHRGGSDRPPFVVAQSLQPGGQQRRDRGRDGDRGEIPDRRPSGVFSATVVADDEPVVDQHRHHLLDEQRVPAARVGDPIGGIGGQPLAPQEVGDQLGRRIGRERRERQRGCSLLAGSPGGPGVEELGPRRAQQQDRRVAGPVRDVVDRIEQRRLRPMDVLPHRDHRPLAREDLQEPTDRPGGLLGGRVTFRDPEHLGEPGRDRVRVIVPGEDPVETGPNLLRLVEVVDLHRGAQGLGDGPVGDPLPVGQAPADEDLRGLADATQELLYEARLPGTGGAEDGEQQACPVLDRALERALEVFELALPADDRRRERSRRCRRSREDADQSIALDRLRLAFHGAGFDRLDIDRVANEPVGVGADQDLARLRGRLQASRGVDRISGQAAEIGRPRSHEDFAGVHADP